MCLILLLALRRHRRSSSNIVTNNNSSANPSCRRQRQLGYWNKRFTWLLPLSIVAVLFMTLTVLRSYFIIRWWDTSELHHNQGITKHMEQLSNFPSFQEIPPTSDSNDRNISSVDYMACCGAGHRISKMADAYYLSKRLNFALRGYWGYCDTYTMTGSLTEVFQ
jgi:hypothetical protein